MNNALIREIQKKYEDGQYLQIVQRLLEFDELPSGVNVSIAVEAIANTFLSSSPRGIEQADTLMCGLKLKGYLNRSSMEKIFDAVGDAILNTKGEIPFFLISGLMSSYDQRTPENLIRLYSRAETREAKSELADIIGSFYKKKGLLALVDNLYSQQIIGNDSISALLKKHSLLADISLKPDECDVIISVMLDFLETSGPKIDSSDDEIKFKVDIINRTSAARILVVLNKYPKTSKESRARIRSMGDMIVTYRCADRMYDAFVEIPLSRYLSGNIN